MILMRILPGALKELSRHVPTVLFQVVEWSELTAELPRLSRRLLHREGHDELFPKQKSFLAPLEINLTEHKLNKPETKMSPWAAERYLTLFFAQLFSPHGLFLDLRPEHYKEENGELLWHPTGLWTKFGDKFQEGLLEIYDGFYLEDEVKYESGLKKIGLISDSWTQDEKEELSKLFKTQFGTSISGNMIFSLEEFKESLFKIGHFLLVKKVTITKDFLYLGIYLVTLYANLEESKIALPVKDIYLKTKENLGKKVN